MADQAIDDTDAMIQDHAAMDDAPADQAAPAQAQAIPTGDEGAIGNQVPGQPLPVGQGDNGQIGAPQPDQPKRFGPLGRIVSYLMGEGAAHPQELQQAADSVDEHRSMSKSDANILAVEQASQQGGKEAAWKLVQANRVAYNAKQAFAMAALQGNQQKRPDIRAAVDAANQATDHILDGSNVKFAASQNGVTATVKPASGEPQTFNLTPQQFRQYLNVGGDGQFDKQMQGGVAATLARIAQNNPQPAPASPAAPAPAADPAAAPAAKRGGSINGDKFGPLDDGNYPVALQRKAWQLFPGAGSSAERADWMSKQESATDALKNKVDVAEATGEARNEVAKTMAGGRQQVAVTQGETARDVAATKKEGWQYASKQKHETAMAQLAQKIAHEANSNANQAQMRALKLVQTKMMSAQPLSKEEQAMVDTLPGAAQASAAVTAPGARPQQAPAVPTGQAQAVPTGQPPVPGAKFYKGTWYTRGANGESVPVQQ